MLRELQHIIPPTLQRHHIYRVHLAYLLTQFNLIQVNLAILSKFFIQAKLITITIRPIRLERIITISLPIQLRLITISTLLIQP